MQVEAMLPGPQGLDHHTLGLLLAGTGLLFSVEPMIALTSAKTYRAINHARRQNRISILWPAGLVVLAWGAVCLFLGIPPREPAHWCLLLLAVLCVAKGLATLSWPSGLAGVSERIQASDELRRFRCLAGLLFGAALIGWGMYLYSVVPDGT